MAHVVVAEVDVSALTSLGIVLGAAVGVFFRDRTTKKAAVAAKDKAAEAAVLAGETKTTVDKVSVTQDERTGKIDRVLEVVTTNVDFVQKFADLAQQSMNTNSEMAGYLRDCEASKAELQKQVNALNVTVSQLESKVASLQREVAAGARRRATDMQAAPDDERTNR